MLVFNTCTIREKADDRFVAHLMEARAAKQRDPDKRIVVGGCWSESMKDELFDQLPVRRPGVRARPHLASWATTSAPAATWPRGHFSTFDEFSGHLPLKRERPHQAWLQISMGCNSNCSYCIVPSVRGREHSRRPADLVARGAPLAADGVRELTLLGQNVNSCGRDLPPASGSAFGEPAARARRASTGIERDPLHQPAPQGHARRRDRGHGRCAAVCEHLHLPLQSGSTRILKAMRRTYSRERYLALVERIRDAMPDIALTTDIIVGFPGETEADFAETLEVVDAVGYDHAFTFVYSPRRGTEAARDGRPGARGRQARAHRAAGRPRPAPRRARATPALVGTRAGGAGRGPEPHRPEPCCAGAPAATRPLTSRATRRPGSLVEVPIDGSTSQTLSGRPAPAAVAA